MRSTTKRESTPINTKGGVYGYLLKTRKLDLKNGLKKRINTNTMSRWGGFCGFYIIENKKSHLPSRIDTPPTEVFGVDSPRRSICAEVGTRGGLWKAWAC